MKSATSEVTLDKVKSIWNRNVKFEFKSLFKAMGKAATHVATLKFEELGNDVVEAGASLGLEIPIEELAFSLVSNSASDALRMLTRESMSHITPMNQLEDPGVSDLGFEVSGLSISFDENFFENPSGQPFVGQISFAYKNWLLRCGVAERSAKLISARFPAYFVNSLSGEWRKNAPSYKRLIEVNDSPFKRAEETLMGWNAYFFYLKKRVSENIFDEPFSLAQLYVPLNAYYLEKMDSIERERIGFKAKHRKVCVDLEVELMDWLGANNPSDALRVISGGPGSGKSSFARMFCCDVFERRVAKLFIFHFTLLIQLAM